MFRRWMKKPRVFNFQQAMEVFSVVCLFGELELQNWKDYNGSEIDLPNCMDEILQVQWPRKPLLLQVQTIWSLFENSARTERIQNFTSTRRISVGLLNQPWLILINLIRVAQFVDNKLCKQTKCTLPSPVVFSQFLLAQQFWSRDWSKDWSPDWPKDWSRDWCYTGLKNLKAYLRRSFRDPVYYS